MTDQERLPAVMQGTVVDRLVHAKRHPVIPVWIRDEATRKAAVKYAARHVVHLAVFHGARTPKYLARTVVWSPRGAYRVSGRLAAWMLDAEAEELRSHAVATKDVASYEKLAKRRDARVRTRSMSLGATALTAAAGVAAVVWFLPVAVTVAASVAAVGLLGYTGRPYGRVFLDTATTAPKSERVTQDMVTEALGALGIPAIRQWLKDGNRIDYRSIPYRDGLGWRVDLDLPLGVTAVDVIEKRKELSSALRRPLGAVWPEPAPEVHDGRLILLVLDEPMRDTSPKPWPLAKDGTVDLFQPIPFALDQRGRVVVLVLMFAGALVGAMPRMGKTMALRIMGVAAALDPTARIRAWELKGTGDLECLEHVAHEYGAGADPGTLARCLTSVRAVYDQLDTRAETLRDLPKDLRPENKVTRHLCDQRRLGLYPEVLIISECQEAFSDRDLGKEFDRMCTAIVKRGPALGIIPLFDTQRPDKDSLPTQVSANIGIRFCLRVMGQIENDMVLGTSKYKQGFRATEFAKPDKGIGWLIGEADDPQIVRTYYMDTVAADEIARRAKAMREAAGTLSGYALGEQDAAGPVVSLLDDVLAVMGADDRLWSQTVAERLAGLRPDFYKDWDADTLGRSLSVRGIATEQMWLPDAEGKGRNRQGITRDAVLASAGDRGP